MNMVSKGSCRFHDNNNISKLVTLVTVFDHHKSIVIRARQEYYFPHLIDEKPETASGPSEWLRPLR